MVQPELHHAATVIAEARPSALTPLWLRTQLEHLGLDPAEPGAVALSGGPDSLALCALLAGLGVPVLALIVDHGLRPESASEADHAARQAEALGVRVRILRWQGPKPQGGLMAAARAARYQLLIEACRQEEISRLYLAHHADDQRETFQLRQGRGSGWRGLAAMPWLSWRGPVQIVRPLLEVSKSALLEVCDRQGLAYVQDPSNANPRFARARLRLSPPATGNHETVLSGSRHRRQQEISQLRALAGSLYQLADDYAVIAGQSEFLSHPHSVPLLRELLGQVGQQDHPVRDGALQQARQRLIAGAGGVTLSGCRLLARAGRLLLAREPAAIAPVELAAGRHDIWWDRRWLLRFDLAAPARLAPLAAGSWRRLPQASALEFLPACVRASRPALWQNGQVVRVLPGSFSPLYRPLSQIFSIDYVG